jgi:putative transposase
MLPTLLSQMTAANELDETPKERRRRQIRNRMVYNGWGLYSLVQMLAHKCLRFGKELHIIDERDSHRCKCTQDMPLWKWAYRCTDENCAVNLYRRFAAGPVTHSALSVVCCMSVQ